MALTPKPRRSKYIYYFTWNHCITGPKQLSLSTTLSYNDGSKIPMCFFCFVEFLHSFSMKCSQNLINLSDWELLVWRGGGWVGVGWHFSSLSLQIQLMMIQQCQQETTCTVKGLLYCKKPSCQQSFLGRFNNFVVRFFFGGGCHDNSQSS